jgi:type IV pilus assembly protein PilB
MAAHPRADSIAGLPRALVQHGRLTGEQVDAVAQAARRANLSFVDQVLATGLLTASEIAEIASSAFGLPLLDLSAADASHFPADLVDPKLVQTRRILPLLRRGKRLVVAVSDPSNTEALDEIKFQSGMAVDPVIVEHDKLCAFLKASQDAAPTSLDSLKNEEPEPPVTHEEGDGGADEAASDADDAPVVKFIHKVLLDAINDGASDVHFEPYEKTYRVRCRVDGELHEVAQPPLFLKDRIASRIKVISKLDISERRIPQDGRMKLVLSKTRAIDFRVSTLPTVSGEKIVMRILDPSSATHGIDALGYEPDQKEALLKAIHRPHGMILVTGPTGSGKTVSLYTCINILNKPDINISTAEDPVEISLPGVNQANVNEKTGLTFAAALKSFLRQDPDVIMVGEIRDLETAEVAIKAAQTGHLVLSTLHTNDAPATLSRLLNMGIAPFNIASSVILITAQRLARRLCTCKVPVTIPREALMEAGFAEGEMDSAPGPYGPAGCERCKGTGYKGRIGIYQVMPITEEMSGIIMSGGNARDIEQCALRQGVRDLRQSGLLKVKQGLTSLEEVMACTNE